MSAKGLRSWQVRAQALIFAAIVASETMRVVATASIFPCITMGTLAGVESVMHVTVEAETFMHRDRGARLAALPCLAD